MTPMQRATVIFNLIDSDRRFLERDAFVQMCAAVIAGGEAEYGNMIKEKCARVAALSSEHAADVIRAMEVDG